MGVGARNKASSDFRVERVSTHELIALERGRPSCSNRRRAARARPHESRGIAAMCAVRGRLRQRSLPGSTSAASFENPEIANVNGRLPLAHARGSRAHAEMVVLVGVQVP